MKRILTYAKAVNEAIQQCMDIDPSVYAIGLGVPDPKAVFGTMAGLVERFGSDRVLDMPCAENGMTGVVIGSAMSGMRPVMVHQRIDFALLAVEQIINQAAKWHYMFGGETIAPIVIRLIIGRGWGQGPQHSQSLHSVFAHIPGLKVAMPATPSDAKGMMVSAIQDPSPVIFIEHRWLHNLTGVVDSATYTVPFGEARIARQGTDVTVAAISHSVIDVLRAAESLAEDSIHCDVIDMRCANPLDTTTLLNSVLKTKRLLVVDQSWRNCGFAAELIASVMETGVELKAPPTRMTLPDCPCPTSPALSRHFYIQPWAIENRIRSLLGLPLYQHNRWTPLQSMPFDVPDTSFTGPF